MKLSSLLLITVLALGNILNLSANRREILLNDNWQFRFSHQVEKRRTYRVDLPHTWNAQDALSGKLDYKRGIGNYEKQLQVPEDWKGKRLFLRFQGANTIANVFINKKHLGEHRGGYGAFVFEITDAVKYGEKNSILVRVSNAEQLDIMPLVGDFNMYGGIYRDVHLVITDELCISPLDYASPGVYLVQQSVTQESATVQAKVNLSNYTSNDLTRTLQLTLKDGDKTILSETQTVSLKKGEATQEMIYFSLKNPRLWDGQNDPFMYSAEVSLLDNGQVTDQVIQPLGLRYFEVDPDKGFLLNGKHLQLRGVCRHQDRAEVGNALRQIHHEEDTEIMLEMGVNAVRLAHYPQSTAIYDLMDKHGFVVWAEIPFIGPGGYEDKGFVDQESFKQNGREQLIELIRQHYNHPSICFWGIFNELKEDGDNPIEYVKELNELSHREDPTRPTTSASNQGGGLNYITDLIAWNRYDGWYGSTPKTLATFLDNTHKNRPELKIGVSEYGAGASIYHQQDSLSQTVPTAWWHPENWQTYYHIENWRIINERPFVWGSFVWNMFDFGAAHRTEGDRPGINDKGLVTFDRKHKKDSFYFYKANWNQKEPVVYLAERRIAERFTAEQTITAYTNTKELELFVNGKSIGKQKPDEIRIVTWKNVVLQPGKNLIRVVSTEKNKPSDEYEVIFSQSPF